MHTHLTRSVILGLLLLSAGATLAEAQGNWQPGDFGSLRFRLSLFEPEGSSDYWDETFDVFTGSPADLQDLGFGIDYLWRTSSSSGLLVGTSWYGGSATQAYRDYVDSDGFDIRHRTSLDLWDVSAAFVYRFGSGSWRATPYLGVGGGFLYWDLEEVGDFIDFSSPGREIFFAGYRASGWTWEALGLAGIDIPVGYRWSFFAEGRYRAADDELGDDFAGFGTIDLSGWELSAGFSWNF
jgi:hypothetical protein